jgi:hypothetical protein
MKKILLFLVLAVGLILSGCQKDAPQEGGTDHTTTTVTTPVTTAATTAPVITTIPNVPGVTTSVPDDKDDPTIPGTSAPSVTEDTPLTTPETKDEPVTYPTTEEPPIVLDKGSESELSALLTKYPIVSAPGEVFQSKTLIQLIESATLSFSESKRQSITAGGYFATSMPFLGEISRQQLELSYLTDGTDYALSSIITEKQKVTDDRQVYIGGWLYNTSTVTENGKITDTDNYKIAMTQKEFEETVLANTQLSMDTVRDLAELFSTAEHIKAGMLADGSFAIVAKGYAFDDLIREIDPDGNIAQYIDTDSFSKMETALVMDADGTLTELYVKLPLGIQLEGVPMTMTIELTVVPGIPESAAITVPEGGDGYIERTIEEVYGDEDDFVFDW